VSEGIEICAKNRAAETKEHFQMGLVIAGKILKRLFRKEYQMIPIATNSIKRDNHLLTYNTVLLPKQNNVLLIISKF